MLLFGQVIDSVLFLSFLLGTASRRSALNGGPHFLGCGPAGAADRGLRLLSFGLSLEKMGDRVSKTTRSRIMASVATHDTGPEIVLRKALHALGFRYTTHSRTLPGRPDIVFPRLRKVIFVHGCFWHGHRCRWGRLPKSRLDYWGPKIAANRDRDTRTLRSVRRAGWRALVIWQCQIRNLDKALPRVLKFLRSPATRKTG